MPIDEDLLGWHGVLDTTDVHVVHAVLVRLLPMPMPVVGMEPERQKLGNIGFTCSLGDQSGDEDHASAQYLGFLYTSGT